MMEALKLKSGELVQVLTPSAMSNYLEQLYTAQIAHYSTKYKRARNADKRHEYLNALQVYEQKLHDLKLNQYEQPRKTTYV
jgi:hypothetical protein